MGLKEWLIPQDKIFFELLENHSVAILEGANKLSEMLHNHNDLTVKLRELKDIELKGDAFVKDIYTELSRTFITPIDKEDIILLASTFDDILDLIYVSANRFFLYEVDTTKAMIEMEDVLVKSVKELHAVMPHVRNLNSVEAIEKFHIEVNRLENIADEILNKSLAELFNEKDPITIMKYKELLEIMELATDKCEDAANVIGDILLKHR